MSETEAEVCGSKSQEQKLLRQLKNIMLDLEHTQRIEHDMTMALRYLKEVEEGLEKNMVGLDSAQDIPTLVQARDLLDKFLDRIIGRRLYYESALDYVMERFKALEARHGEES